MLNFALIGLVCNSLGCYWVRDDDRTIFADQQECVNAAFARKTKSAMYFDAACIVVPKPCYCADLMCKPHEGEGK